MKVLIVDDNQRFLGAVAGALRESGYVVSTAFTSDDGWWKFENEQADLVILDILLPGKIGDGVQLCRVIRESNHDVPVLMLTAMDSPAQKVAALDSGADDYLVKPFHLVELQARVRALLRRAPRADAPVLEVGDLRLFTADRRAERNGRRIDLTAKEFTVLAYLMRNEGTVVSQTALLEHAWDFNYDGFSNVVETQIRYLRRKLNGHGEPDLITTRRGSGYLISK